MEFAPMRRIWPTWFAALLVLPVLLSACGAGNASPAKPLVLTSFYPLYYLTTEIAGDRADVRNLVPAGAEPHDWEPSTRNVADIQHAALFIYNGAGFESWVQKTLAAAPSQSRVVVEATQGLPLIAPPASATAGQFTADPHIWLDPVLAKMVAVKIAAGLTQTDPAGKATFEQNLADLNARLDSLDTAYKNGLHDCTRHDIITSHAAFGYLAHRYQLNQIAVEGLTPDAEPTPARIAEVVKIARDTGAKYIFFETLVSPRVAQTIADEAGAKTLTLDPLEGVKDEQKQTYFTVMNDNLANLRLALDCH
jgi:zinc transport system substrate-binding protein